MRIIIMLIVSWFFTPVIAKNLYVNNSGTPVCSNATTYAANSAAQPWCTIMRAARGGDRYDAAVAAEAAQPGDIVFITEGIYWENGQVGQYARFSVHLNPVNNGTAANPITFRGVGNVNIRINAGFRGGTIGCSFRDYIIWDNFKIEDYYQGSTSDTGPVVFHASNFCQLLNSDITGHPGSYYHGYTTFVANYRGISLEPARNTIIRNNRIHDMPGGQNECGIMAYDSNDNIIENNTIYNNGCGIFIKGQHSGQTQSRNIIRKNLVYGNRHSNIRVLAAQDTLIYQNIVHSSSSVGLWAGFGTSERSRFFNNTVYGVATAIVAQGAELIDVRFFNNIYVNISGQVFDDWSVTSPMVQDVRYDRNVYFNYTTFYNNQNNRSANMTFEQFRSAGYEANGGSFNPAFVDPSNLNFRLQSSSAARTIGRDSLNMFGFGLDANIPAGAYVTGNEVIGASTNPVPAPIRLSAPTNLRIGI